MTLIVGVRCEGGVVMAADGAATIASPSQKTARQPTEKLKVLEDRIVVGVSGPHGLGQQITDRIGGLANAWIGGKTPEDVSRKLGEELWKDIKPALQRAQVSKAAVGQKALQSVLTSTLLAYSSRGSSHLLEVNYQCNAEKVTDDVTFATIGAGKKIADPFLAFLKRTFWPDALPSIPEGKFAAIWTLLHAIETDPTGSISEPLEMVVLEGEDAPRRIPPGELAEHREHTKSAEAHLTSYRQELAGDGEDEEVEQPPEPDD